MAGEPTRTVFKGRLADERATACLAQDVACALEAGDLVTLSGDLGAGKTSFARALIRSLACDPGLEVPSPTFPIRLDYPLERLHVTHADLYRIGDAGEIEEIGIAEALGEGVLLVEWPERAPHLGARDCLAVSLGFDGAGRTVRLAATPELAERLARSASVRAFLDRAGWSGASRAPIKGDASGRAYERVTAEEGTAILMNAPARPAGAPAYGGRSYDEVAHRARDVGPFLAVAHALRSAGVHAPGMIAAAPEDGFLLLEDLGTEGIVTADGRPILPRYEAAIDLLAYMHARAWPKVVGLPGHGGHTVPPYDRDALLVEISLFADWYLPGRASAWTAGERHAFLAAWGEAVDRLPPGETLVLRDFHSPNILWIEDAEGLDRVGIIDFQDALIGHPAYDVASLAQDARVEIAPDEEQALKARYVAARMRADPSFDPAAFDTAYAILGAQRATKVLGAFARLARVEGKGGYERHSRHVAAVLARNLAHPVLSGVRLWYDAIL